MVVHHINIGGEVLRYDVVNKFLNLFSSNPPDVVNLYGPTECTVAAITYRVDKENCPSSGTVPIGLPLDFANIYILDDNLSPVPVGNTGELYIGGECVGRGYISRPDLTAERFIQNPFVPGDRLYKTGDLARQLCDGNIEYVGRIDAQIKIHGYRVELEEIESKLLDFSSPSCVIKGAAVLDKEDAHGDKYLIAYMVAEGDYDEILLRKHLENQLPFYMLPSKFEKVKEIPLTYSGKIDRKALTAV
jgi:acyl-CoA synthetase (AMP-forming)/AMP-acid ligase II